LDLPISCISILSFFFFFTTPAPSQIYTLSLHDALPISAAVVEQLGAEIGLELAQPVAHRALCQSEFGRRQCDAAVAGRSFKGHRSEEHTSELQSQSNLVCRLLLEKKKKKKNNNNKILNQ